MTFWAVHTLNGISFGVLLFLLAADLARRRLLSAENVIEWKVDEDRETSSRRIASSIFWAARWRQS